MCAGELERRRVRQRELREVIQIGEIAAAGVHVEVDAAPGRRASAPVPSERHMDVAGLDGQVERIRTIRIQVDERPAGDAQSERLLVERALALDAERLRILLWSLSHEPARCRALPASAALVDTISLPPWTRKSRTTGSFGGGRGRRIRGARAFERPVRATGRLAVQVNLRVHELDARQDHIALQQRQQLQLRIETLDAHHGFRGFPWRVADGESFQCELRCP